MRQEIVILRIPTAMNLKIPSSPKSLEDVSHCYVIERFFFNKPKSHFAEAKTQRKKSIQINTETPQKNSLKKLLLIGKLLIFNNY